MTLHDAEDVDVTNVPELLRLAEEVRASGRPLVLRRGGEELARIVPARPARHGRLKQKKLTEEDVAAFRAAAGGWADFDVDAFLKDVYTSRDLSIGRPPVEL